MYGDIALLTGFGMDIVCVKSTQNRYFVGFRIFGLPEVKLLADAVESFRFITRKKSTELITKLAALTSHTKQRSGIAPSTWTAPPSRTTSPSTMPRTYLFGDSVQNRAGRSGPLYRPGGYGPSAPFFAWVFTFAGGIQITGPESALDEMRQMAKWLEIEQKNEVYPKLYASFFSPQ